MNAFIVNLTTNFSERW